MEGPKAATANFEEIPVGLEHFTWVVDPTGRTQPVYIVDALLDGLQLQPGDEVGVFDGDFLVGAAKIQALPMADPITVYLTYTPPGGSPLPGAQDGNDILFRVWDQSADREECANISEVVSGVAVFTEGAPVAVSLVAPCEIIPIEYTLTMAVYPAEGGTTDPAGWQFTGWTGEVAEPGNPSTTVLMDGDKTVTANFELIPPVEYTLTMAVNPAEGGTTDPAVGAHVYTEGGWQFTGWTGEVAEPGNPSTTVLMDGDKTVTANFELIPPELCTLTMVVNPAGGGITDPVAGTHVFEVGTECPLTATANPGWQFVNWTGDVVDANSAQTVVLMDEDQTVTANFELIPLEVYTLSMAVNPSKGGTTDPAAGDHDYDVGTEVKITAIANPGWEFSKWIGDVADPKLTETTVTMDADKEVIAKFCEIPRLAVDPDTQYVVADAGTTTFDIKSNISWAVTETEDWLSITPVEGHRDGLFTVTFDENLSIEGRIGKITVSGRGLSVDVFVNQAGADPYLTAEPANRDVGFLADTTTFDIKSNISWKVSESEDWLSVTPVDGKGDGTLAVIYDENILLEKRIGKLTVSGGGLILNLTVTQAGAVAYLTVEPANQEVGAKEGKTTFDVKSNISWLEMVESCTC
jgi:uncharacterized repeat protein (TIGR02543 family)